jgi:hypothetical protein
MKTRLMSLVIVLSFFVLGISSSSFAQEKMPKKTHHKTTMMDSTKAKTHKMKSTKSSTHHKTHKSSKMKSDTTKTK